MWARISTAFGIVLIGLLLLLSANPMLASGSEPGGDRVNNYVTLALNPYKNVNWATWNQYKANYHTHTTYSDGSVAFGTVVNAYNNANYDILAMTDHNVVTWPWTGGVPAGMLAIRGNEFSNSHHDLGYHEFTVTSATLEQGIPNVQANGGRNVIAHPGRYNGPTDWAWYIPWYRDYSTNVGLEVYNQGDRYPSDRPLWDNINENFMRDHGQLVWGYSNDDMHTTGHYFRNYQFMLMPELTDAAHKQCMDNGASYFVYEPTGNGNPNVPRISNIVVDEGAQTITITATGYSSISWIGPGTSVVGTGATFSYAAYTDQPFVRAVLDGPSGDSFTQPFGFTTSTVAIPNAPSNPIPANGAVNVGLNPTLSVDVTHQDGATPMTVRFYDASGPTLIGTQNNVASGGTASITWSGRAEAITYNWYATASDGTNTATSVTWSFTTQDTTPPAAVSGLTVEHYGIIQIPGTNTYNYVGVTQATNNNFAYFNDMDSDSQAELETPNSRTEFTDVFYTAASISDDTRAGPSADPGFADEMGVEYRYTIAEDGTAITQIVFLHEARYSAAVNVQLYLRRHASATWDAIGTTQAFSANVDATMTRTITADITNYVNPSTGLIRMVFYPSARATVAVDYAHAAVSYNTPVVSTDHNTLNWTHNGADVAHYNIYRAESEAGTYTLINTVPVGTNTYCDLNMGQADTTYWWYRVRAEDAAGNIETNTNNVQEPGMVVDSPYAISLTGKAASSWVFVSFPSGLTGNIETILNDATSGDGLTTWTVAKWYNPQTPSDPWKTYRVGGTANDMPSIHNGMGFWIWITANGGDQVLTLNQHAATPASTDIQLYAGWNMVGYPSATNRLASATLPAQADQVAVWSATTPYITDSAPGSVTMSHGNAYWVRVTADCTWTVQP